MASVQPGGEGFAASVRVRLLHASVRRRILTLAAAAKAKAREGGGEEEEVCYFDVEAWGVPINDLDSIGTVLSFSAALIWIGLPRQGIYLTQQEIQDYHALWRWVAYLLGTPADTHLADWRTAKVFFESLIVAELEPSEMSGVLANNILTALSNQPPAFATREFMCAEARWLNGGELCDALGIARPGLWYRVLVGAQCVYFMGVCYVKKLSPEWDRESREVRAFANINNHLHLERRGSGGYEKRRAKDRKEWTTYSDGNRRYSNSVSSSIVSLAPPCLSKSVIISHKLTPYKLAPPSQTRTPPQRGNRVLVKLLLTFYPPKPPARPQDILQAHGREQGNRPWTRDHI